MIRSPLLPALAVVLYCAGAAYFTHRPAAPLPVAAEKWHAHPQPVRWADDLARPQPIPATLQPAATPAIVERWLIRRTDTGWSAQRIGGPASGQPAPLRPGPDAES
jgi:hypothetical protein